MHFSLSGRSVQARRGKQTTRRPSTWAAASATCPTCARYAQFVTRRSPQSKLTIASLRLKESPAVARRPKRCVRRAAMPNGAQRSPRHLHKPWRSAAGDGSTSLVAKSLHPQLRHLWQASPELPPARKRAQRLKPARKKTRKTCPLCLLNLLCHPASSAGKVALDLDRPVRLPKFCSHSFRACMCVTTKTRQFHQYGW